MTVQHDPQRQRFFVPLEGDEAFLAYRPAGNALEFHYVYVPPAHRKRGISGRLCIAAFDHAREQGRRVIPTCPFIAGDFLSRFPQYQDLVRD